jgi:hypothetical protein
MGPIDRDVQPSLEGSRYGLESSTTPAVSPQVSQEDGEWLTRARDAYASGRTWFDTSIRLQVEKNLAHFRSQHAPGSKYHSEIYQKKSHSFVPRTRAMVRRTEAATAIAFFATQELVKCSPMNEAKPDQVDAAEVHNALLNHRLENDIPWFMTVIGGAQDASNTGAVISKQEWKYLSRKQPMVEVYEHEQTGELSYETVEDDVVIEDKPSCRLIPIENLILDPAADWIDPINTSPYLIELVPTYVYEIQEKMEGTNPRTGKPEYRHLDRALLGAAIHQDWDSIRRMREGNRVDKYEAASHINEFQTVWVHKNHVRKGGRDWVYDTLGVELLLSDPEPAEDVYPHLKGRERPYAMGTLAIEAHKQYPMAPAEMVGETQSDLNDLRNLRMDNVKLGLNKRFFVRRNNGVDIPTLLRNIPGSAVLMNDTERDVKETQPQDVTASSYQEQDRINLEFDEIGGSFSAASIGSNRKLNETVGGMTLLSADASQVKEYEIRTFSETWVEKVLRQLVALQASYESDMEVLEAVASRAKLTVERCVEVLRAPVRTRCDVGFNSTSPERRLAKITMAIETIGQYMPDMLKGLDAYELAKEVFGAIGFRDGSRFFPSLAGEEDPQVAQLKAQIQELQQFIETKQIETQGKIEVAKVSGEYRLAAVEMQVGVAAQLGEMKARIDAKRLQLEHMDRQIAVEAADKARRELFLQREALSHQVQEDDRQFMLQLMQLTQGGEEGGENGKKGKKQGKPAGGGGGGAYNLAGNDKAGVISRDQYGDVPQAAG